MQKDGTTGGRNDPEGSRLQKAPATVPLRLMDSGLSAALSVIVTAAMGVPGVSDVGANFTLMVQFPLTATVLPQVLVCEYSALFAPVIPMLVILSAPVPVLVNVTV